MSQDYKTIQTLISDSALNIVSGSKRKPKRFDLAGHFQAYKPSYCQRYHRECVWGAELPYLIKCARISIHNLKARYPGTMILVGVVWSGNELVGKHEIEEMQSWPLTHLTATTIAG